MNSSLRTSLLLLAALGMGALELACGSPPQAVEPSKVQDADDDDQDTGIEMMQEFGGMNEEKVNAVIKKLMPSFERCLAQGSDKNDLFGGDFKLLVKVNRAGEAMAAHAEDSTLGDYEVERCIVEKARSAKWPKPVGGLVGLVHYGPMTVEPGGRPPVAWDVARVNGELTRARDELSDCGGSGPFRVTAYVGTDGRVSSAGISHADDKGDGSAKCLVDATLKMKFPSPGSWPAKVTFER